MAVANSNTVKNQLAVMAVMLAIFSTSSAVDIDVGGNSGWTVKTYTALNASVNDVLVFKFITNEHNVASVTKSEYDSCSFGQNSVPQSTSPVKITINATSDSRLYFICSVPGHCNKGQKLIVNLVKGTAASPAISPASTAGKIPPADTGAAISSPPPPSGSSAAEFMTTGGLSAAAVLSVAVAVLLF